MTLAKHNSSDLLASILGPALLAVAVLEIINFGVWNENLPHIVGMNGPVLSVVGLAILLLHPIWKLFWTVNITLIGLACLLGGIYQTLSDAELFIASDLLAVSAIQILHPSGFVMTVEAYRL